MRRLCTIGIVSAALLGGFALTACEEEVSHKREVKVDDGEVKTRDTTVTESADSIQIERKTEKTEDGETTTKTQTETIPKP